MLAATAVCSDFLFAAADVSSLLSDIQTSSSPLSQQALVDVALRSAGARHSRQCLGSGSPARGSNRVHFGSPAPSSAL